MFYSQKQLHILFFLYNQRKSPLYKIDKSVYIFSTTNI